MLSYGTGKLAGQSEKLLGKFIREYPGAASKRDDIRVATKFAPYPFRIGEGSMRQACQETLDRLERPVLDVAQLHWPPSLGWQEAAYLRALAGLRAEGRVCEIGLSNYGPRGLRRVHAALAAAGAPLASNQVQFSLISRLPLESGLVDAARELGVTPIAYSPLGLGLLTGKYGMGGKAGGSGAAAALPPPPGPRGFLFRSLLPQLAPLLGTLAAVADARRKTCSQVAVNWTMCKGAVPIVGVKSAAQAREAAGALGWRLSAAEVEELDAAARRCRVQAQQNIFQTD
eukprot:TRINITY_DN6895_c0_g1_i3.p1 TRINITY_DN6895_c0_g1~~TRINITY_DN6895_c0_g1_i3.p1  ORF type:complete len:286 (-),score=107.54 TRINITY_DN6895_c0_g1_i3:133-990(-)